MPLPNNEKGRSAWQSSTDKAVLVWLNVSRNARNKSSGFDFVRWTRLFADFEYFRQRAWMSKTILEDYVKNVQVDSDVQELEKKLRDVAAELTRTGWRIFIRLGD